uniref:Cytochrome P450 CYP749A22-like n=1 Tax=Davidia involucrata TaxID=16924 RepID=A0A5B6ZL61_DAVIN
MGAVETITILLSSSLCLYLLLVIIKFLNKVWWKPSCIQSAMQSQGIKGPSYRFIYGNTKEILKMRKESMSRPMDLSHQIFPRIQPHFCSWINTYGMNCLNWYGPRAQLIVTESEFVKEILNNKERTYPKTDVEGYLKKLLGDGLGASEGEKWAKLRKLANHAFRAESLKNMIPAMIASVDMMLERWKQYEGKEVDVFEEFRVLTSEVISRTAFGSSYLEGKDIFEMLMKLGIIIVRNAFKIRLPGLSKFLKSSDDIESDKLERGIRDSIIGIIKKRENAMHGEVDNFGNDFLGLLVKANHDADEDNRITVEDVVDECKTFYFAGHETTSTLLSWTILLLAIHTDWQEKVRQEVLKLFGQQHPNSEGIGRLKTMNMIINESLRLYPPVVSFARKVKREVKLGKFILPADIHLVIPILALHHDRQIWGEDVHLFKPERFSEGVAKATSNNPAVFLPFGLGPRSCAGTNFAINEAKIALSMILQRYTFTLSPAYIHSPAQILTLRPQHGVQVILHAL